MKPPKSVPWIVSRCDRLGDLILSLPVLALLQDAGVERRVLHCASYAEAIGEWALANGLCTDLWVQGRSSPGNLRGSEAVGLSLFHSIHSVNAFRSLGVARSYGPRTRLSALWSYTRSRAQHRSRVAMSEMHYNWDLAAWALEQEGISPPIFRGLPALRVPSEWTSPLSAADVVLVVSNRGSAANWPLERYLELADSALAQGLSVDFLVSGTDAQERQAELEKKKYGTSEHPRTRILTSFEKMTQLIAYLAQAGRVISSSTGPLHIAHAAGVPVLGIYPTRPLQETFARWRPDGYWHGAPVRWIEFDPKSDELR